MTDPIEQLKLAAASASGFQTILEEMMETYHRYSAIADISLQETINEIQSVYISMVLTALEQYSVDEPARVEVLSRLMASTMTIFGIIANDYEAIRSQAYVKRYPTDEA